MRRFMWVLLLALSACGGLATQRDAAARPNFKPTIILISFDGFRWDYPTKAPTPNLHRLMARGVRAENLIPIFPSMTFPNHYAIVTGLYAEHHGIVGNSILDPTTLRTFAPSKSQEVRDPMWWGGEPIWVTVQRAGQAAGIMFWPGSEAPIGGMLPRYLKRYDESLPGNQRVDQVLRWLDLPGASRPTFLSLYFEDADTAGHDYGPDSDEVRAAITRDDEYLGRLMSGLESRRIFDQVNIIVVADHGMAAVSPDSAVVVDDYIALSDVEISGINPVLGIFPKAGKEEAIYRGLVSAHPRLKVYQREGTPEQWHYRRHPRIPPIVGIADEGWQVLRRSTIRDIQSGKTRSIRGEHGYDPMLLSMRAVFVASGPAFKSGVTVPPFENVNIYNVLAAVLHVTPTKNDGDPSIVRALLK